jgi:hypothetical protein
MEQRVKEMATGRQDEVGSLTVFDLGLVQAEMFAGSSYAMDAPDGCGVTARGTNATHCACTSQRCALSGGRLGPGGDWREGWTHRGPALPSRPPW